MEERGRVERAEPERTLRIAQRFAAVARARERPRQDVVGLDARALTLRAAGARERRLEAEAVVDVEECSLELGRLTPPDCEAVDRADEGVLLASEAGAALGAIEVAEEPDELGGRLRSAASRWSATARARRPRAASTRASASRAGT